MEGRLKRGHGVETKAMRFNEPIFLLSLSVIMYSVF
jgi:hypothetical protein